MAGGYARKPSDPVEALAAEIKSLWSALRDLARPTGTSIASLVAQVQAALANITTTVQTAIEENSYTADQIDAKIADPGNVSTSGSARFDGGVASLAVFDLLLTHNYRVQYVTGDDGSMGYVPSSRRFKQDITTAPDVKSAMLAMRVVTFRYIEAVTQLGDAAWVEWGVIAEELDELGLTWAVDYDENGLPFGVKYERLVLAVIPVIQDHEARLKAAGL